MKKKDNDNSLEKKTMIMKKKDNDNSLRKKKTMTIHYEKKNTIII